MLRFTSFLAFLCISFLTFCVIFRGSQKIALEGHAILDKIIYFNFSVNGIFASMPVVSFAYIFHAAFFPIWSSMANQTQGAVTIVTSIAITICGIVYMAIATFGYLDFGVFTKGNILINYPTNDILILVAKIGYLAVVCFAYPISAFPLRSSLDGLIFKNQPAPVWRTILGGLVVGMQKQTSLIIFVVSRKKLILSCCAVGATYALAVLLPGGNIQVILGMTGASAGTLLAYIYPALYYIILVDNSAPVRSGELYGRCFALKDAYVYSSSSRQLKPSLCLTSTTPMAPLSLP
jgi:amino acid permease